LSGELHKHWRTNTPGGYHLEYGYSCMDYEIAGGLWVKLARTAGSVHQCGDDRCGRGAVGSLPRIMVADASAPVILAAGRGGPPTTPNPGCCWPFGKPLNLQVCLS
jgi:hypothetical protein